MRRNLRKFATSIAQDSCPYLWKRFNRAKYLTGHLEDSPGLAIFSRYKTGFVEQQVDFYLRPLMLDAFGMVSRHDLCLRYVVYVLSQVR